MSIDDKDTGMSNANHLEISRRDDGIYLSVFSPKGKGKKVSFDEVSKFLDGNGVQGWGFVEATEAITESLKTGFSEVKVTSNPILKAVDERISVEITADKMNAYVIFSPPANGGKNITEAIVLDILNKAGVTACINESKIREIVNIKNYGEIYEVAAGWPPVHGKDGYLEFYFNIEKKKPVPKLLEDGKVDFHQLNLIETVMKGTVLVREFPPKLGKDGLNVLNKPIIAMKGKLLKLPKAKNAMLNDDGDCLIAAMDGQVTYINKTVTVFPVLNVESDVGTATGDINFIGSIIIKGNVLTDYKVTANGDVEIFGVVEGAKIMAEGNIIIHGGVQGMGKASLIAKGNLSAKFLENCTVDIGGNISSDSVLHSNVSCEGFMEVNGKNGLLVGGNINVYEQIIANVVGSRMATLTKISVGSKPENVEEYKKLTDELKNLKTKFEAIEKNKQRIDPEDKISLIQSIRALAYIKDKMIEIHKQLELIMPSFENSSGTLTSFSCIYPGVHITIGNSAIHILDRIKSAVLYNDGGKISIGAVGEKE